MAPCCAAQSSPARIMARPEPWRRLVLVGDDIAGDDDAIGDRHQARGDGLSVARKRRCRAQGTLIGHRSLPAACALGHGSRPAGLLRREEGRDRAGSKHLACARSGCCSPSAMAKRWLRSIVCQPASSSVAMSSGAASGVMRNTGLMPRMTIHALAIDDARSASSSSPGQSTGPNWRAWYSRRAARAAQAPSHLLRCPARPRGPRVRRLVDVGQGHVSSDSRR